MVFLAWFEWNKSNVTSYLSRKIDHLLFIKYIFISLYFFQNMDDKFMLIPFYLLRSDLWNVNRQKGLFQMKQDCNNLSQTLFYVIFVLFQLNVRVSNVMREEVIHWLSSMKGGWIYLHYYCKEERFVLLLYECVYL